MKTKPLNNNVLIEVLRDDDGVSRTDENETLNRGKVVDVSISAYHLTASSAHSFTTNEIVINTEWLRGMVGKIVRWEQYAEGGQTFEEDGKTYAIIPFWRLIAIEENE